MKKEQKKANLYVVFAIGIAVLTSLLSACTPKVEDATVLRVGADLVPHSEILNFVKPELEKQGITLEIVNFDDAGQLNPALQEGEIDANYFQHVPYLDSVAAEKGYAFEVLANVHVEPIGLYSQRFQSLQEIPEGSLISIPDNPSNEYRALVLLEANGLVKLSPNLKDYAATPADIIENPKNLKFIEVDAAQLTRSLPDVDAAVINTNRILEAGIDPNSALLREDAKSPYGNIVVVRSGEGNRPELQKLKEVLLSPEVAKFITDTYGVAVVPAF